MSFVPHTPWPQGKLPAPELCHDGERMRVLASFGMDDLQDDTDLDQIVRFASELCEAPITLVSIVEEHRQRFLAGLGLDAAETPRDRLCAHAMLRDRQWSKTRRRSISATIRS